MLARSAVILVTGTALVAGLTVAGAETEPPLPEGAGPVWDTARAYRASSTTRGRICLNGLWRFRSAAFPGPAPAVADGFDDLLCPDWQLTDTGRGTCRLDPDPEVRHSGSAALRLTVQLEPQTNFFHLTRAIVLKPECAYTLGFWIRTEFESGYLALEVQDLRNDFNLPKPAIFLAQASDRIAGVTPWRYVSFVFRTRPGGERHRLLVRHYGDGPAWKGTAWLDELTITERSTSLPTAPALPTDDAWGFAKVPGSPKSAEMVTYWHPAEALRTRPGSLDYAWYERAVVIPAEWAGRRIAVTVDRVSTLARLYANGQVAGEVGWFGGEAEVTALAKPGTTLRLTALVRGLAADDVSDLVSERGLQSWQRQSGFCGFGGNVWLDSAPAAVPRLGPFRVDTKVSDMTIAVQASLSPAPAAAAAADLTLLCQVRDGDRVVKEFGSAIARGATSVTASAAWPEAELWEVGKPRLYTMVVSLRRGGVVQDESLPESFGFREFEVRGRFFYLNGIKLNLRPCSYNVGRLYTLAPDCMARWFDHIVAEGRNFVYTETVDSPNRFEAIQPVLDAADARGVLMAITPLQINPFWERLLAEPQVRTAYSDCLRRRAERVWNHPSLVLYRLNMNFCGYSQDQNPLLLSGEVYPPPESPLGREFAAAALSSQLMAEVDSTRRSYHHASGNAGDIYTLNNYLCWPEPQDLREWLAVWAERGTKPLMMVEFDLPYPGSFSMLDPTSWWCNEPLMSEYGAILLGARSYALEDDDYVDFTDLAWNRTSRKWESAYGYYCSAVAPILDACAVAYYSTVLPAWRTWGIPGGLNAWEYATVRLKRRAQPPQGGWGMRVRPPDVSVPTDWANLQRPGFAPDRYVYDVRGNGHIQTHDIPGLPSEAEYLEPTRWGQVMPQLLQPLYAYVAGPGPDWPEQDHACYAGETVRKSVVLLNDQRAPVTFAVRWRLTVGGKPVSDGSAEVTVAPAESAQVAVDGVAPAVAEPTTGEVQAEVQVGNQPVTVTPFAIRIWPRPLPLPQPPGWLAYDPVGRTTAGLTRLGLTFTPAAGEVLPDTARVLVIGSEALGAMSLPGFFRDLPERVARGLQVLVFEQTPEVFEKRFGLRAFTRASRQAWARDPVHPWLTDLGDADLANWRGRTTLGPLDPAPASLDESQRWKRVWRCSQRGTVASTIVEKPHTGAFHPIVDGEFDLRYMMLWDVPEGQGRLVFCQLDVSDRLGREPAADRLARNLIADLAAWTAPAAPGLCVAAAPETAAELQAFAPGAGPDPTGAGLVLAGRGSAAWLRGQARALKTLLAAGGRVLAVGLTAEDGAALEGACGVRIPLETRNATGAQLSGPLPEVLRGISPAEVHWRERREVLAVTVVPAGGWRTENGVFACIPAGKGEVLWLPVLPSDFDLGRRPDLVFTQVNTARLLTLILGNCGVHNSTPVWTRCLAAQTPASADGLPHHYRDRRVPRDDPYAYMRW